MAYFARYTMAGCLLVTLFLAGCAVLTRSPRSTVMLTYPHATEATMTQFPHEHFQAVSNVANQDARALVDDFDLLFLTDRPSRLTRWHSR